MTIAKIMIVSRTHRYTGCTKNTNMLLILISNCLFINRLDEQGAQQF